MDSADKQKQLDDIAVLIRECEKCPLFEGRTNAVPGEGHPDADIVFIGEGPGKKEDTEGEPFVGAAGRFLSEMLSDINMSRADVFITNIVKCRPPENRDPFPDEVDICTTHYLWKQLDIIQPKIIATLGRHAMHRFVPEDKKISETHGKLFSLTSPKTGRSLNIVPLYHPAAALYNGSMREVLKKDFVRLPKILERVEQKK